MRTTGPHPYFTDVKKQQKLEEAIRRGYIKKQKINDTEYSYELTLYGEGIWIFERMARG